MEDYKTWLLDKIEYTQYKLVRLRELYNDPTRLNDRGRELCLLAIKSAEVDLENYIESAKQYIEEFKDETI